MNKSLDTIVLRYAGFGLLFTALLVLLYLVRGALPVFVVAGVLAFAMEPVLQKMEKRGHSRARAVGFIGVVFALIGCVFLGLATAGFQQGVSLVQEAPAQIKNVKKIVESNREKLDKSKLPKPVKDSINDAIAPYIGFLGESFQKKVGEIATGKSEDTGGADSDNADNGKSVSTGTSPSNASTSTKPAPGTTTTTTTTTTTKTPPVSTAPAPPAKDKPLPGALNVVGGIDIAKNMLLGLGSFLAHLFLTFIIAFGLMLEAPRIKARTLMLVPPPYRRDVTELSTSINQILGQYVRGQLIVCATFGALCTVAFELISHFFGMQYPLILGAFAAVIYVLPYVGLAIVFILGTATAYFTSAAGSQFQAAGAVALSVIAFNLTMDYFVSPRVLGRGVGLHPLMVIFALLCGFELGGPLGTVAAVPFFAALRVIAIYLFPQLVAPLPDESAQAVALDQPHGPISEETKRVAEAEART